MLDQLRRRLSVPMLEQSTTVSSSSAVAESAAGDGGLQTPARAALHRRQAELSEQVLELHWDLGGLVYEMAIRDHFRLDVLLRRAAELQERDAELAEIERLLRLVDSATAGTCPSCAAPRSRGAPFCWQCGATLMERVAVAPAGGEPETAIMDPLGSPGAGR